MAKKPTLKQQVNDLKQETKEQVDRVKFAKKSNAVLRQQITELKVKVKAQAGCVKIAEAAFDESIRQRDDALIQARDHRQLVDANQTTIDNQLINITEQQTVIERRGIQLIAREAAIKRLNDSLTAAYEKNGSLSMAHSVTQTKLIAANETIKAHSRAIDVTWRMQNVLDEWQGSHPEMRMRHEDD